MKKLHLILFLFIAFLSCRKEVHYHPSEDKLMSNVKAYLKDNLSSYDFQLLNFNKVIVSEYDSGTTCIRIGYLNTEWEEKFVLLKRIASGEIENGKIIKLSGRFLFPKSTAMSRHSINGEISIQSLNRMDNIKSSVKDGYIMAFHPGLAASSQLANAEIVPDDYGVFPEFMVSSQFDDGGSVSFVTWMSLVAILDAGSGGGSWGYNYYDYLDPYEEGGAENLNNLGGNYTQSSATQPIYIDFEYGASNPGIEIQEYMKCFTDIPDEGASGWIEIFSDIPVNGNPNEIFDWSNGSPGHTFIQLKKQNGNRSVTQNIGFYPREGWKSAMTPAPIEGKFVDNSGHEFNASIKIPLNAEQIKSAVTRILYLARFVRYDIDEYNCTDWALEVFNQTVKVDQRLEIPRYDIPGGMAPKGSCTPQGLYQKLKEMKQVGGPAAANITLPLVGWAGSGDGPCK